jgi:2-oxoglutarate dehydrogenase E2 component (dihydrolipoamide succinyltransferase)
MPIDVRVPSFGESITEGVLARWIKHDGDLVLRDEPIAELESEKATTEIRAQTSGKLKTAVAEGQTVAVGSVIALIDESVTVPTQKVAPAETKAAPSHATEKVPAKVGANVGLSPSARVHAEVKGVDPNQLTGTGRGGRIIKEDVLIVPKSTNGSIAPMPKPAPATVVSVPGQRETREKMSALRQRIAARLLESQQTTASLTTFNEIDMSAVFELRQRFKDRFKEKHGVGLGFMSFFVKAVIEGLRAFPQLNARIDGSDVVYQHFYNIGIAVSTEKGLMVPVLKDADRMSFAQIEQAIAELAVKAREGRISVADVSGGTYTITNGGIFGSMMSTPILNPPQIGILGMHAIKDRPVVVNNQIVIRPMMYVAMTYDHRLIDGRESVQFLVRVKECVENPERLMLEV